MKKVILSDTSLCAIVRDEKMNPAGGIERFVDSTVPYVEQAVIADTGSIDGTREILEEMQAKHPNLRVVDIPFLGYADARNRAMQYVKTKRLLVLDADELLTHQEPTNDWEVLKMILEVHPSLAYDFEFLAISPTELYPQLNVHPTRLFDNSKEFKFMNKCFEVLSYKEAKGNVPELFSIHPSLLQIKHFVPLKEDRKRKYSNWYADFCPQQQPSQTKGAEKWKAFNPLRDEYI